MDELDLALDRFHLCAPEYGPGLSNHGPMAAEALLALGHPALIQTFVDVYAPRLAELETGSPLAAGARQAALGVWDRAADWIATFEAELAHGTPGDLLDAWLPVLLPGAFGAAGHGLIRTAHAARALAGAETPQRRRELAHGLGYWAATHQTLPGTPGARPAAGHTAQHILSELAFTTQREGGVFLISDAVRALDRTPAFAASIERLDDAAQSPAESLGETVRAAAALYLAHPGLRIVYAHAVTIPSAVRLLLPRLGGGAARRAAGYALQCTAAIHAAFGQRRPDPGTPSDDAEREALARHPAEIRYRAACSVEEHAIKLAEACLREDALAPHPLLRLAAADAAIRIGASHAAR